ncbi:hypothetical protein HF325_001519 [Metschnikowia pulcherrima]|uniref:RRM domain-containing protein n=1 Tax=Metschnikowia pulcherrima TaxID=27326 RepID=A0A8H7GXG5_9ASCO|nr:hypothetical protein HF325_001519 [Metschnikowia pulcherrima]
MNAIHKILAINEKELLLNVSDQASWHADYSDTSYIYIGNLHESLTEQNILTIFSQYGNPTHINLVKDRESGKSRGFCYLKYEDQRSCVLAIDNFNGVLIYEKPLKVDHTYYKLARGQSEDDFRVEYPDILARNTEVRRIESAPTLLPYKLEKGTENTPKTVETGVKANSRGNFAERKPHFKSISDLRDDDFSDPMANFAHNDDFFEPVAKLKDDDDFADPMAGFLRESSGEKHHGKGRKHESSENGDRSKRRRREKQSEEPHLIDRDAELETDARI